MDKIQIKKDKYIIWSVLVCINTILSSLVIVYKKYWYLFIIVLGLASVINSINVIFIILNKVYKKLCVTETTSENTHESTPDNTPDKNFIYILPCYNETEKEINNTLNSILHQKNVTNYSKKLIIICDGKIARYNNNNTNNTNEKRTDQLLIDTIFKNYIKKKSIIEKAYKTWNGKWNDLDIYTGTIDKLEFIILIKTHNIGKRDSLTLIRRMIYYNTMRIENEDNEDNEENEDIYLDYLNYLSRGLIKFTEDNIYTNTTTNTTTTTTKQPIEFIIGTDADTILDHNCAYELLNSFKIANTNTNKNSKTYNTVVGIVGLVDVVKNWNPLVIYQYCEYLYAQYLRRYFQSTITHKVNCLSGCVQLIKVCHETCGNDILNVFNRLPTSNENIINHIRSYASEDRNHICIMFQMYPYVTTIQNTKAIAYTNVPNTLMTFLRQRKRWTAGSVCNDMLLLTNNKHNLWERIQSFTNILVFSLTLFIFVVTIDFIISIIQNPTFLMLILASVMILPILYAFTIPFVFHNELALKHKNYKSCKSKPRKNKYTVNEVYTKEYSSNETRNENSNHKSLYFTLAYYYFGFILYFTLGSLLNLIVHMYMLYNIDDLNWNSKSINNEISDTKINTLVNIIDTTDTIDTTETKDTKDTTGTKDTIDTTETTDTTLHIKILKRYHSKDLLEISIV